MTDNPVWKTGASDIGSEGGESWGCGRRDMWARICGGRGDQAAIHPAPPRTATTRSPRTSLHLRVHSSPPLVGVGCKWKEPDVAAASQ